MPDRVDNRHEVTNVAVIVFLACAQAYFDQQSVREQKEVVKDHVITPDMRLVFCLPDRKAVFLLCRFANKGVALAMAMVRISKPSLFVMIFRSACRASALSQLLWNSKLYNSGIE